MMVYVLSLYAVLVAALTGAEVLERPMAQRVMKPAAALGFILIAAMSGALDHSYGQIIFAGLIACAIGDILLLSRKSHRLFLAGMAAFALGHVAYLQAFIPLQVDRDFISRPSQGAVTVVVSFAVLAWLIPHLPKKMRLVVPIYVIIILLMVIMALGLPLEGPLAFAMVGAVLFAISDIFVARDRFILRNPKNALAITPLYFGAQALIGLSTRAFS